MEFVNSGESIIRKMQIGKDSIQSEIQSQNIEFPDIRDCWKAYLSQTQQTDDTERTDVTEWSGKGEALNVAELFSGPEALRKELNNSAQI